MKSENEKSLYNSTAKLKLLLFSLFGFFTFFITFEFNGSNSILIDHIANILKMILGPFVPHVCLLMIIGGAVQPFIKKTWNKNITNIVFSIFKIFGVIVGFMYLFKIGPQALLEPGMIPFLYEKLAMSLSFVIPIGSAFIIFLTNYGLMEFIGVFAKPFMRPVYKTPGRSAIDAVASFVGSYSIALIITGKQYKSGFYTKKEAAIIATGFSTVSATFCVIVAKTLGLMDIWNIFFWTTLFITFVVTAITVRIYPLSKIPDEYVEGAETFSEPASKGSLFKTALDEGLKVASTSTPLFKNLFVNLKTGIGITMGLVASIMSVGLLGLVLAEYTPVFDVIGYIFYPFTAILGFAEPHTVAKAASMSIAEMLIPAALVKDSVIITRFVIGVVSISEILFFSASIPCILATEVPISIKDLIIIWVERVILSILIATPIVWLFSSMSII